MKLNFLALFFVLSFTLNAQDKNNVNFIDFKYSQSIKLFSSIKISIYSKDLNKAPYELEAKYYEGSKKKTKKINIDAKDFNTIVEYLFKINTVDLIEGFIFVADASTTEIEFGHFFDQHIKFELTGVNKNNPKLKDFVETVQLILKLAEIKIEDYN